MYKIYKAGILFLILISTLRFAYELYVFTVNMGYLNYGDGFNSYVYMSDLLIRHGVMKLPPRSAPYRYPVRSLGLRDCKETPTDLRNYHHPTLIDMNDNSMAIMEKRLRWLHTGGHWHPTNCTQKERIAVVIPYKTRYIHLRILLFNLHLFLRKQLRDYTLFFAMQSGNNVFNRGLIMNAAFTEINKLDNFDCFIFHDIDLMPLNEFNTYGCGSQPRQLSNIIRNNRTVLFGGVIAIARNHFKLVNGYSNLFSEWSGEDDDMANRLILNNLNINRSSEVLGRYYYLKPTQLNATNARFANISSLRQLNTEDGLKNVQLKYNLRDLRKYLLYTLLTIDVKANDTMLK